MAAAKIHFSFLLIELYLMGNPLNDTKHGTLSRAYINGDLTIVESEIITSTTCILSSKPNSEWESENKSSW